MGAAIPTSMRANVAASIFRRCILFTLFHVHYWTATITARNREGGSVVAGSLSREVRVGPGGPEKSRYMFQDAFQELFQEAIQELIRERFRNLFCERFKNRFQMLFQLDSRLLISTRGFPKRELERGIPRAGSGLFWVRLGQLGSGDYRFADLPPLRSRMRPMLVASLR